MYINVNAVCNGYAADDSLGEYCFCAVPVCQLEKKEGFSLTVAFLLPVYSKIGKTFALETTN